MVIVALAELVMGLSPLRINRQSYTIRIIGETGEEFLDQDKWEWNVRLPRSVLRNLVLHGAHGPDLSIRDEPILEYLRRVADAKASVTVYDMDIS